ncbi:MAG TPA: hypothetical protein VK861_07125 [Bacteroidales bacterium]|nr:hypothetical protein [Bacteroidales bacterium]
MTTYRYTQFGTFSVVIMIPALAFILVILFASGMKGGPEMIILGFAALTVLICLLIFYRLVIEIDNTHIRVRMGIGLFSRKYPLSGISACKPVRNPPFYGIGIRLIPGGWLYNVSGLSAIELRFKNKKSVLRIGTDKPEEVSQTINRLINQTDYFARPEGKEYAGGLLALIVIFIALFLPAIIIVGGSRESSVEVSRDELTIKGMYGFSIGYLDIARLDSAAYLPAIKRRTNGFAAGRTLKGNFTLSDGTRVRLFITKGSSPYINIQTFDKNIWLNFKDPAKTRSLFEWLKENI